MVPSPAETEKQYDDNGNHNDNKCDNQPKKAFMLHVFSPLPPFSYNINIDVDFATITVSDVMTKLKEVDDSFISEDFHLGFHPGASKTITTFGL